MQEDGDRGGAEGHPYVCPVGNSKEHEQVPVNFQALLLSVIKDNDGDSVSELNFMFYVTYTPSNGGAGIRVEWTLVE